MRRVCDVLWDACDKKILAASIAPGCTTVGMRSLLITTTAAALAVAGAMQGPRVHDLPLVPEHVHWGYYDARVAPALRIASGDRVRVETMVAGGLQRVRLAGATAAEIPQSLQAVHRLVTEPGPGAPPMRRSSFVRGARPGDTLALPVPALPIPHPR